MPILFSVYWVLSAVFGWLLYVKTSSLDNTFYDLGVVGFYYYDSLFCHVLAASGMVFGYKLYEKIYPYPKIPMARVFDDALEKFSGDVYMIGVVFVTLTSLVAFMIAFGPADLLRRDYYLAETSTVAPVIGQLSSMIGMIGATLLVASRTKRNQIVGMMCSFLLMLLIFSKGSRFAVVGYVLFGLSPLLSLFRDRGKFFKFLYIFILLISAIPLMHSLLYFRHFEEYGLLPFVDRLPEALAAISDNGYLDLWLMFGNISFSVAVTQVTINMHHSFDVIFREISPLPGFMVGWSDLGPTRRVTMEVPYSAIGELYGFSPLFCFLYFSVAGLIFSLIEKYYSRVVNEWRALYFMLYSAFLILFSMLVLQYNLRDATRILYYIMSIEVVIYFVSSTQFGRRDSV